MARHRTHSVAFEHRVAQELLAGERLHGLAKGHDLSRNPIRPRVENYEAGVFDEDTQAADLIQEYEARIAALGLEFLSSRGGGRPSGRHRCAGLGALKPHARRSVHE